MGIDLSQGIGTLFGMEGKNSIHHQGEVNTFNAVAKMKASQTVNNLVSGQNGNYEKNGFQTNTEANDASDTQDLSNESEKKILKAMGL